jgi:hypothetical protein
LYLENTKNSKYFDAVTWVSGGRKDK